MFLIQIGIYLVKFNVLFQNMFYLRTGTRDKKCTVPFTVEISTRCFGICIKYVHNKLSTLRNEVGKSCKAQVFFLEVLKRSDKTTIKFYFGNKNVNFTLEQATKAHRGSRGRALPFL